MMEVGSVLVHRNSFLKLVFLFVICMKRRGEELLAENTAPVLVYVHSGETLLLLLRSDFTCLLALVVVVLV